MRYQSFNTARNVLDGIESMRAVQKGQLRYTSRNDVSDQNKIIDKLFG